MTRLIDLCEDDLGDLIEARFTRALEARERQQLAPLVDSLEAGLLLGIPTHMADTIRKNVVDSLREAMGVPKGAAPCVPSGDVVRGLDAGMTWAAMDYFPEPGEDEPRTAQEEREFNAAYEWVRRLARAKDGA